MTDPSPEQEPIDDLVMPQAGQELKGTDLKFGREIGRGASAIVYEGIRDNGERVALKVLRHWQLLRYLQAEVQNLEKIGSHKNICTHRKDHLRHELFPCIEYEFSMMGDLKKYMGRRLGRPLTIMQACSVIAQILSALVHVHGQDSPIAHRDLKPQNLLIFEDEYGRPVFRVTDFGFAKDVKNPDITQTQPRTPDYASPQQGQREFINVHSTADDIFSLGVIWYQLLLNDLKTFRHGGYGSGLKDSLNRRGCTSELVNLIHECLDSEREPRPSSFKVKARLGVWLGTWGEVTEPGDSEWPKSVRHAKTGIEMVFVPGVAGNKTVTSFYMSSAVMPVAKVPAAARSDYCENNELNELTIPQRGRALDHLQVDAKKEDFWPVITIQDWFVKPKRSPSKNAPAA